MLIENTSQQVMAACNEAVNFESPFQQVLQQQHFLLRTFNKTNKWQLWLSERPMLKRSWVNTAGLDKQKVVHLANMKNNNIVATIEKALLSKTCSYVVACINNMNESDKQRLQQAVLSSGTHLFLVRDEQIESKQIQYH